MKKDEATNDILQVQGRMTLGYGVIPKMVMQDRRLTAEAKCIYAYFCSYAGAGTTAFPSRRKVLFDLQMGVTRFYHHFNLLKEYGYITVNQRVENGKFKNNVYTLVEMIVMDDLDSKNKGTENKDTEPCTQNRYTDETDEPCIDFEYTEDAYTKNDHIKNNIKKNNSTKNQQSRSRSKSRQSTLMETLPVDDKVPVNTKTEPLSKQDSESALPETARQKLIPSIPVPNKKKLSTNPAAQKSTGTKESSKKTQSNHNTYDTLEAIIKTNINYESFLTERNP